MRNGNQLNSQALKSKRKKRKKNGKTYPRRRSQAPTTIDGTKSRQGVAEVIACPLDYPKLSYIQVSRYANNRDESSSGAKL